MSASLFVAVVFVLVSAFLAGCRKSDGPGFHPFSGGPTISGQAVKGPLTSATVDVYAVNSNGTQGGKVGTTTTDASGNYSVTPTATSGAVMVEVVGGSYVDELTGVSTTVTAGKALMSTMVGDLAAIPASVPCTPLTHIARKSAFEKMKKGTAAADAIKTAGEDIGKHFQLPAGSDVTKIVPAPVDPATGLSTTASAGQTTYGLMIAALIQQARDMVSPAAGVPIGADDMANFFDMLANDAKDGSFDGADATDLVSGGALTFTPTKTTGVAAVAVAADKIQKAASGGMATALGNLNTGFFAQAGRSAGGLNLGDLANKIGAVTASFSSSGSITGTVSVDTTVTSVENWAIFVMGFTAAGDLDTTTILAPSGASFPLTSSVKSSATGAYTVTDASGQLAGKIGQNLAVVATKDIDTDGTITGDEDKERLVTVVPIAGSGSSTAPPCDRLRDNQFRVFQQQVKGVGDPSKVDFGSVRNRVNDASTYGQAPIATADAGIMGNVAQAQDVAEENFLTSVATTRLAAGNVTIPGVTGSGTGGALQNNGPDIILCVGAIRKEKAKRFADFLTNVGSGMSDDAAKSLFDEAMGNFFENTLGIPPAEFDNLNAARNGAANAVDVSGLADASVKRAIQRDNFNQDKFAELDAVRDALKTVLGKDTTDIADDKILDLDPSAATTDNLNDVLNSLDKAKDALGQAVDQTRAQDVFKPGADNFVLVDQAVKRAIEKFAPTLDFKVLGSSSGAVATSIVKCASFTNFDASGKTFIVKGTTDVVAFTPPGATAVQATGWLKLVGTALADEDKGFEPNTATANHPGLNAKIVATFVDNARKLVENAIGNDITAIKTVLDAVTIPGSTDAVAIAARKAKVKRAIARLIFNFFEHNGDKQNAGFTDNDRDGFPAGSADPDDNDPSVPGFQQFKDSDGDGVPDFIETQSGFDAFDATSLPTQAKDTDKDGHPDNVETFLGKNPLVVDQFIDIFKIDRLSPLAVAGILDPATSKPDGIPDFVQDLDRDGFPSDMELGNG
ncbi:MAG: hypothetical protein HY718_12325, partial [Planctomycetes bacterium]|nr:hypothetical protein [Planctomycetota bacterium]